jgi:hypothetical protein
MILDKSIRLLKYKFKNNIKDKRKNLISKFNYFGDQLFLN